MTNASVIRQFGAYLATIIVAVFVLPNIASAGIGPAFNKFFSPNAIGPGSISQLMFSIDNSGFPAPVDEMAFTDRLPAGLNLAVPAFVSNSCLGTVTAPDGGNTISLADGALGGGKSCQIIVNVTGTVAGTHTNLSGDLTSSAGNSGNAFDELVIDAGLPGFSKSFAPSTVAFGGRSRLTLNINCSSCITSMDSLAFVDTLPTGMLVANPANAATNCGTTELFPPELTAVSGTSVISFRQNGTPDFPALFNGDSCSVTVDVIGEAVGSLVNVTGELTVINANIVMSSGKAAAVLEVTGFSSLLEMSKEFTNDPVSPGGTVNLEFMVTNKSRSDSATAITFSDDLNATLTGLEPTLPLTTDPVCGAGSSLSFSGSVITLAGGSLFAEQDCTFSVELTVPVSASAGIYTNTAGPVSGEIAGSQVTGNEITDLLYVVSYPALSINFSSDTVAAGDSVTLEYTIVNTNPDSAMSAIEFIDELTDGSGGFPADTTSGFLPFPLSVTLPPVPDPPCGVGSALTLISVSTERQGLGLTGGSLAAAGSAGDSCTFSVTIDIPVGLPGGNYMNTTEEITAVLDNLSGTPTVIGPPASDTVAVVTAPRLNKNFIDDPLSTEGGEVTLEFNLAYPNGSIADATAIAFTDDLTALTPAVPDLEAISVNSNDCADLVVDISTPSLIDFSGGTLSPGQDCSVSLTLFVPAGSPVGAHTNITSDITAKVDAVAASNSPAEDDLVITSLIFTKEFTDDPVIPGDTTNLRFTIENIDPTEDANISVFTDDLSATLTGLVATGGPSEDTCGGALSGTTNLIYIGGSVSSGTDCIIEVEVLVPVSAASGVYNNVTSLLVSDLGTAEPATDKLIVEQTLLELTKEFTDDPVYPEDPVTLEFNLTNLSSTETVTDISFTDDLGATLAGLEVISEVNNTCTGSTVDISTPKIIAFTGGTLTAGQSCVVTLALIVPAAPLPGNVFPNTTFLVTGKVGSFDVFGDPASDDLLIAVAMINFSKSFSGPTTASGTVELSFTLKNPDLVNAQNGLSFSDNLGDVLTGLVATVLPASPCGPGSSLSGTSSITLRDGNLAPGDSCTFVVKLLLPADSAIGDFTSTTSELLVGGIIVSQPATATLKVLGTVGGTVSGLAGSRLVLRNKGENVTIRRAGPYDFTFAPQVNGSAYDVTIRTQPTKLSTCKVSNGKGTLAGTSITDVVVTCVNISVFSDSFESEVP